MPHSCSTHSWLNMGIINEPLLMSILSLTATLLSLVEINRPCIVTGSLHYCVYNWLPTNQYKSPSSSLIVILLFCYCSWTLLTSSLNKNCFQLKQIQPNLMPIKERIIKSFRSTNWSLILSADQIDSKWILVHVVSSYVIRTDSVYNRIGEKHHLIG